MAIAPSRWLADCAKNSALMTDWPVEVIPNPVDASVFQPHRRAEARRSVGLPASASIILSGAMGGANDPRKGFDLLAKALGNLKTVDSDYLPVIFGQEEPSDPDKLGLPTKWMGRIEEDRELALLYSAADAMVVPSRMEAFGQTASEALACGTPVIAFDATGLKDIVTHRRTGYLASPYSTTDLAHGIKWVVDIERRSQALGQAARERAERLWDSGTVADQYIAAYRSMLSR